MAEFRVIAGTYERLLYGLDACWKNESDPTDKSLDLKLVIAYATHIGCVKSVATGGNYLASGSTDEVIKLYDLKKRKELGSLHSHDGTINQLAFHRSTHLLSASDDGSIAIYRTKDWELLKSLRGHKGPVIDIAIHPSGKLAISIARDMTLRMWDLLKGRSAFISRLHHSQDHYEVGLSKKFRPMPEKLRWNQQGTRYAISYADGIDVFSMSEPDSVKHIRTPTARQRINCMAFHQLSEQPAGEDYLVVGYEDGMVRVWGCDGEDGDGDINNKQPLAELKAHDGRVKDISVIKSSRGTLLLTISSNGVLRVWDLDSFIIQPSLPLANPQFMLGEHDTKGSRLTCLAVQMMNAAAAADAVKEDDEDELIQSMEGSSSDEDEQGEEEEEAESQVSSSSSSSSEEEVEQQQNKRRAKFSMRMPMKNKSNKRTRNK